MFLSDRYACFISLQPPGCVAVGNGFHAVYECQVGVAFQHSLFHLNAAEMIIRRLSGVSVFFSVKFRQLRGADATNPHMKALAAFKGLTFLQAVRNLCVYN